MPVESAAILGRASPLASIRSGSRVSRRAAPNVFPASGEADT